MPSTGTRRRAGFRRAPEPALNGGGEGLLFHLFPHTAWGHPTQVFRPDIRDGGNKAAQFIHRKERFPDGPIARVLVLVPLRMGKNGTYDLFVDRALAQDLGSLPRVLGRLRPALVVEVVKQASYGP